MPESPSPLCECNWPKHAILNEWFPITYDEDLGEFQLILDCGERGKGSAILRYCPSCGGAFPDSLRGDLFTVPTEDDMKNVAEVMSGVKTVADMKQKLGDPDETIESEDRNQYSYRNQWESLELVVTEFRPGISFLVSGQQKPNTD